RRAGSRGGGAAGGAPAAPPPMHPDPPPVEPVDSEDCTRHLGPPGADETRQPDDLAAPELERDVREDSVAGQALDAKRDVADRRFFLREEGVERAADHEADDLCLPEGGRRPAGAVAAAPH